MVLENIYLFLPFLLLQIIPLLIVGFSNKRPIRGLITASVISFSLMGIPAISHMYSRRIGCAFLDSENSECVEFPIQDGLVNIMPEAILILLLLILIYWAKRRFAKNQKAAYSMQFD